MKKILAGTFLFCFILLSRVGAQGFGYSGLDPNLKWDVLAGAALPLQSGYVTGWGSEVSVNHKLTGGLFGTGTGDFYKINLQDSIYYTDESYWSISGLIGLKYYLASSGFTPYLLGRIGITNLVDQVGGVGNYYGFNGNEIDPLVNLGIGIDIALFDQYTLDLQAKVVDVFASFGDFEFMPIEIGMGF